jgi:hypothetical protein
MQVSQVRRQARIGIIFSLKAGMQELVLSRSVVYIGRVQFFVAFILLHGPHLCKVPERAKTTLDIERKRASL